jgi:predicted nucleic acid-binding protein
VIVVDTSALIDSLCGAKRSLDQLTALISDGERLLLPSIVLYEWLRGPRLPQELQVQEELFPRDQVLSFSAADAATAAGLYRRLRKARGREIDLAIAAMALTRDAALWTLNHADFRDISGLQLMSRGSDPRPPA